MNIRQNEQNTIRAACKQLLAMPNSSNSWLYISTHDTATSAEAPNVCCVGWDGLHPTASYCSGLQCYCSAIAASSSDSYKTLPSCSGDFSSPLCPRANRFSSNSRFNCFDYDSYIEVLIIANGERLALVHLACNPTGSIHICSDKSGLAFAPGG